MVKLKQLLWPWAIFPGLLACYLLQLTTNYYWDGIFFAQVIEDAPTLDSSLLHPNHLLYNLLGYLAYRGSHSLGWQLRAVEVLQIINCFISVLSAYVLFRILRECIQSMYLCVALTLLFGLSATWWKFSTDADSYIASVFFLLISFYLILPTRKPRPLLLAVSLSLSMLFHQLAIFFFPVAVLGILSQTSDRSAKERLAFVLQFAISAFVITFPIFYYSFYLVTGNYAFGPFLKWITTFSPEHGFTFNAWDNLTYTLRGHSRLFVGGRLNFLRELMSPVMMVSLGVLLVLAALFFLKVIRYFREVKEAARLAARDQAGFKSLRVLCCVWIGCYLLFLFFFIPQNTFYRLFYLPAIIILLGTLLAPYELSKQRVRRYRVALFVSVVIAANLTFSAYPYAQVRTNPILEIALKMKGVWVPGTTVYFATWNTDNGLVRYFNPLVQWLEGDPAKIEREIVSRDSARPAWIDTTLIQRLQESPEGRTWLERHTIRIPDYEIVNSKYRLQFFRINRDSFAPSPTNP